MKKNNQQKINRIKHLDVRLSEEEFSIVRDNANLCGITLSKYVRKCLLGHKPKLHLTEREIDAYCSISDARGDLVHISNALKGRTSEQRKAYFGNETFMLKWIEAVTKIIQQWDNIIEKLKD